MERKERIVRVSAEEMQAMIAHGEDRTDWAKVDAMSQEEVERLADEEDGPLPEGWEATAYVGTPLKQAVELNLDLDIVNWFKALGPGYEARINTALRSFVQDQQHAPRKA